MGGSARSESDDVLGQLQAAHLEFRRQASMRGGWGFWTGSGRRLIGPMDAAAVGSVYRWFLAAAFVLGVILTMVGGTLGQLGGALVVGSLFAFGSWMAQAWALSREGEAKIAEVMLLEIEKARLAPYAERVIELDKRLRALQDQASE